MTPHRTWPVRPSYAREPLGSQPRPRSWRSAERRPLQGSSPNDRKNYPDCNRHKRACVDPRSTHSAASAGSPSGARIPRRAEGPRLRFFRHGGTYRSDVAQTKTKPWGGTVPPPVGRPRAQVKERVGRTTLFSSSAMSSGRLFLDRVARQHCPSPLHRHDQTNTRPLPAWPKQDISTLR